MFYGENPDLEGELSGAVFIDGTAAATNKTDAYNFGPNNEMYIGKNQTFAVSVTTKAIPASIQIGAKNPLAADSANTVFTVSEIAEAASDILAYYNANHVLPRIIGLIGHDEVHSISDEDFVYLSSMALSGISESGYTADTEIAYRNVGKPTNDAAGHYDGTEATQAQFTEIAARTANYILTEGGNAPAANGSVMTGSDGTIYQISYDSVYLMFARALDAYNTSGSLPATVAYDRLDYVLAEDSNGGPIAGKNLTFTVGSTAAIARTLRVTSATEMFYEVTGAVNFVKNVDGTYTGNIILTNTSSADAVLSLTKLKLVMNGAGAAAASEFSANQNLIDSAIALTEARKDGEGLTEGVVIEINSGVEYENGKVIKPLTAFNVETMSDEIFDNAAKWFFSKLR